MKPLCIEGIMPDIEGQGGRAWRVPMAAVTGRLIREGKPIEPFASLASWVIECPCAHPFWWNYLLYLIHLRPLPGKPLPKIYLPGATHELGLVALDPGFVPELDNPMKHHLRPFNFAAQWIAASDIDAEEKIDRCARDIVEGRLNPDTDARPQWVARFNDSMIKQEFRNQERRERFQP